MADTRPRGLSLVRYSLDVAPCGTVYKAQLVVLARQTCKYGRTHRLITSLDLPLIACVTAATPHVPYLCVVYALDLPRIADLLSDLPVLPRAAPTGVAISLNTPCTPLFDVLLRLIRLLDTPADIPFLAP